MSIAGTQCRHQLRSEERNSTRPLPLKLIPLLRTELEGLGLAIYKHLAPNGVKPRSLDNNSVTSRFFPTDSYAGSTLFCCA